MIARKRSVLAGDTPFSLRALRNTVVNFSSDVSGLYWSMIFSANYVFKYKFLKFLRFIFGASKYCVPMDLKAIGPRSGYAYPVHSKTMSCISMLVFTYFYKKLFSSGRANFFITATYSSKTGNRFFVAGNRPCTKDSTIVWLCVDSDPSLFSEEDRKCLHKASKEFEKYVTPKDIEFPWGPDFNGVYDDRD